jgi:peroxiredoxin
MTMTTQTSSANAASRAVWVKLLAALLVLALAVAGYFSFFAQQKAPEVTFVDLQGNKLSTQDLRGKVVMVNFWATSCTTCVKEMPQMVETYKKYKDRGLEFVAVAMSYDPPNYVLNYVQTRQLPFKVALDSSGTLAKSFGDVQLTPTTFVIDKQGHIVKRYLGEPDWPGLHALLEQSLT